MLHGDDELLADAAASEERAVRALDTQGRVAADELQLPVGPEDPGQEARLAEDLEAVADAEHRTSGSRKRADGFHDRSEARDRARAQVVAVREAAREDDGRGLGRKRALAVPDELGLGPDCAERPGGVTVVVGAGEDDDCDERPGSLLEPDLEALDQRVGEELGAHPLDLARASSTASAVSSRSTTRPTRALATSKPRLRNDWPTASP